MGPDCLMSRGSLCAPKFLPTMQCQVGLCFLSNSFFMYAAMSFSMVNFSSACTHTRTRSNALICRCNKVGGVPVPERPHGSTVHQQKPACTSCYLRLTCMAQSIASWHISSPISAFLMIAFRSDILTSPSVPRLPALCTLNQARNASPAGVQALALERGSWQPGAKTPPKRYNSLDLRRDLLCLQLARYFAAFGSCGH